MNGAATPAFTILLPIVRPPAMLPFAVRSVLAQERGDFELFIVCDGAPAETVACAEAFAAEDPRVRVFAHPKGERHGEAYRHQALQHARGLYVCHIGDDDLWLPHHLTEMAKLLASVDFGHISHFEIVGDGRADVSGGTEMLLAGDLADPVIRQRMLDHEANFFGASVGGYRLSAYRALPEGWSPGPPERPSDLNMWMKFLRAPGLRYGTRVAVTTLKLGANSRRHWPIERRVKELEGWAARLADPAERDRLVQRGLLAMSRGLYHLQYHTEDLVRHSKGLTVQSDGALKARAAAEAAEAGARQALSETRQALSEARQSLSVGGQALSAAQLAQRQAEDARQHAEAARRQAEDARQQVEGQALRAQHQAAAAQQQAQGARQQALAERDALAARLEEANRDLQGLQARLAARENQVALWRARSQGMKRSWSWRLTAPFRKLARLFARPAR